METYLSILILVAFGAIVWAGGITILYIKACREIDALKRKAKENAENAKFFNDDLDCLSAEIDGLKLENVRLSTDFLLCRDSVQKLRKKAGEIAPDGRLLPRERVGLVHP